MTKKATKVKTVAKAKPKAEKKDFVDMEFDVNPSELVAMAAMKHFWTKNRNFKPGDIVVTSFEARREDWFPLSSRVKSRLNMAPTPRLALIIETPNLLQRLFSKYPTYTYTAVGRESGIPYVDTMGIDDVICRLSDLTEVVEAK